MLYRDHFGARVGPTVTASLTLWRLPVLDGVIAKHRTKQLVELHT